MSTDVAIKEGCQGNSNFSDFENCTMLRGETLLTSLQNSGSHKSQGHGYQQLWDPVHLLPSAFQIHKYIPKNGFAVIQNAIYKLERK